MFERPITQSISEKLFIPIDHWADLPAELVNDSKLYLPKDKVELLKTNKRKNIKKNIGLRNLRKLAMAYKTSEETTAKTAVRESDKNTAIEGDAIVRICSNLESYSFHILNTTIQIKINAEHCPQIFPLWKVLGILVPTEEYASKMLRFLCSYESPIAIVIPGIFKKFRPQIYWAIPNKEVPKLQ